MTHKNSAWNTHPDYLVAIKQLDTRFSIVIDKQHIADSQHVLLLTEQDHADIYYFPAQDVQMALFHHIDTVTFCPYKGDARHWSLSLNNTHIDIAAWSYDDPFEQVNGIKNYIAFYPELMQYLVTE